MDRVTQLIQENIDEQWMAGTVLLIARQGKIAT
jgi:hypothetical protein